MVRYTLAVNGNSVTSLLIESKHNQTQKVQIVLEGTKAISMYTTYNNITLIRYTPSPIKIIIFFSILFVQTTCRTH